jgi:HPt (histidine-containing phosphotransfer) domain-containing protein
MNKPETLMGLPEKKKEKLPEDSVKADKAAFDVSFCPIKGIDTVKGVAMTGGTVEGYRQVLSMFRKDAEERVQKFRFFLYESTGSGKFPEKHLASFITQIYALKSASATIGAAEISDKAGKLEGAAKNTELSFIQDNLPDFVEHLVELLKNIRSALESGQEKAAVKSGWHGFLGKIFGQEKTDKAQSAKAEISECFPLFNKLAEALGSQNVIYIDRILHELNKAPLDPKTKEILEQISDQVLMTEFESAIKTINEFITLNK